ncbi:MAG: hypothetical protein OXI53_11060, partial [Nitrospira sp.]|nr:hypothetical protein [Nitrospira sp.]
MSFAVFLLTSPVPEVAAQTQAPISLEYTQLRLLGQGDEGDAIPFIVRRVGDTSQELTVNVRIEGLDDSGRYDPTDANDFDSSKTTSSLTFAADSTAPQTITVQTKTDTTYEPHERFEVVASGTYDGTDFEVRLEGRLFDAVRPTIDLTYTKPFRISEGDTGTVTFTITDLVPHPVNLSYSVMSRHTTSTEKIGDGGATMADHKMTSGMITIPANTKSVTFDVETVEDLIPEPDEQFIVIFKPEGQPPSSPQWNPVDRFTGDNRNHLERKVVVTIVDDDTPQQQQRLVYLHGTVSGGLTGATRATLDEGEEAELTVTLVGDAPTTDVSIPLKFTVFPASEATSSDYRTPASVTIKSGKKSGSVTLQIVDDSLDERHHELLAVEIDDSATSWPQGYTKGDRSRFEVIMRDNDKTSASLLNLSRAALTEAAGARTATFQVNIARRPKGSVTGTAPFVDVGLAEGRARLVLGYTGTAERGTDYRSATTITIPEGSSLPNGCSASGGVVTCTVTLTAIDDNLYEGGSGTTENVKIDLDVQNSRFNDGIARATGYKGHSLTIEDNDIQPTFSIADALGSEAGNLTFTVTRSGALGNDVSVTAATGNHGSATNPATAGADYTAKTESLRFEANDTQKTFQVTVTDDSIDEPDETFAVTLSRPVDNDRLPAPGIATSGGTAVGTITDNDDTPTATLVLTPVIIAESGEGNVSTVTATLSGASSAEVTLTVSVPDASPVTQSGSTLTIAPGRTTSTGVVTLTATDNNVDAPNTTVAVSATASGGGVVNPANATLTITDDDVATLSISDVTATEGATATFAVTLSTPSAADVTVTATTAEDSATDPEDYTHKAETLTIAAGVTAAEFAVTTIEDTLDEFDETFTVTLSDASVTITDATGTGTITDDDDPPVLSIKNVLLGYEGNKGATNLTHGVTLNPASGKTVTVKYADTGTGTATSGEGGDYAALSSGTLSFAPGETRKHIRIKANGDTDYEPDESIIVRLSEPVNATLAGGKSTLDAFGFIENDDAAPAPTIAPGDITVEEGKTAVFTVSRKHDFEELTVSYGTSPGSADEATNDEATSGSDYTAYNADSTAVFREGEDEITLEFETVDDDLHEAPEDFTVTIGSGDYSEDFTVTISDNDDPPKVTLALASSSISEKGGQTRLTASLDSPTSRELRLVVGTTPVTPAVAEDIKQTGQSLTIPAETKASTGAVTLTGVDNNVDAPDKTVTVSALLFGNADIDDPDAVTLTIEDDDAAPTALTLSVDADTGTDNVQDSLAENGGAKMVRVTARITSPTTFSVEKTVTVKVGKAADTAKEGTDYETVADQTITIPAGQTSATVDFTLMPKQDTRHEANETISIDGTLDGVTVTGTTITLTSEDAAPTTLTLTVDADTGTNGVQGSLAEAGGQKTVRVTATLGGTTQFDTPKTVTVAVGASDDPAREGTDYTTVADQTITIAAGAASGTVTFALTPTND